MKKLFQQGLRLLVLAAFCLPSSAIIVANYGVAESAPTGDWDLNWDYVYNYKNSSSVAVGSHWLLTAAHVADDGGTGTVVMDGISYYQQQIISHSAADDPDNVSLADLALVRFDKPFPGYYPLYSGDFPEIDMVGPRRDQVEEDNRLNAVMIGYGKTGTVYSTTYTEASGGNGVKRWGSNKIDGPDTVDYEVLGAMTYNDGLQMAFTLGDTAYEAGVGAYDSGGGTFVEEGGIWKLAGINTIRYGTDTDYTGTFAVSVPAYATWITQTMDAVTGDADSDGIPNWWEEQAGTNVVTTTDQDGDGVNGLDEYVADTDPTDGDDFFEMDDFVVFGNQTVTFDGSTARQYQLLHTTNDLASTNLTWFASHTNKVWGTGTNSSIVVTNSEKIVFYRLQVTLP